MVESICRVVYLGGSIALRFFLTLTLTANFMLENTYAGHGALGGSLQTPFWCCGLDDCSKKGAKIDIVINLFRSYI